MSWILWRNRFSSFEIIVDLFSIENVEYALPSWMHEKLIDIVHIVIDENISDSFMFIILESFFFLQ